MQSKKILVFLIIGIMILGVSSGVFAQEYPSRPINFIIGWGQGGGSDLVSRALIPEAEEHLGQSINAINMPGGSGATAFIEIAESDPDGYTIGNTTGVISTHETMGNIPYGSDDFEFIFTFNYDPGAIWVAEDAPWETLDDLVEDLKENPQSISIASSNPGSITRFGTLAFQQEAGVEFNIVSVSEGEAPGPRMVAGGHVDACQAAPGVGRSLWEAEEIRPLGIMSEERMGGDFADIPTFIEQGYDVTMSNYRNIIAPKGTPEEVVNTLYEAFKKAANSESYLNFMEEHAGVALDWGPEETREFVEEVQNPMFEEIIEEADREDLIDEE